MKKHLLYGPVTSRRLGLSLGIDAVPYKVCTLDCIYCQIGRTEKTTLERRDFGRADAVFTELAGRLETGLRADHITIGGSGEPTLNTEIGKIISGIRKMTDIPVAVLTNGTLLWDPAVRSALMDADVVLPSLDAADEETFKRINRPHPDISFQRMVDGLISFSEQFGGSIRLEVFLINSINTSDRHLAKLKSLADTIGCGQIHLNTAVRPPAEDFVRPLGREALEDAARRIGNNAKVIAEFRDEKENTRQRGKKLLESDLIGMLRRRPCTAADIAAGLGVEESAAMALAGRLAADGRVEIRESGSETYYVFPVQSL